MKIAIDIGHNVLCTNGRHDIGATGHAQEDDLTNEVGELVISKLEKLGHTVVRTLPASASSVSNSLYQRVTTANLSKADIFASIHFNAFNALAYGTETFAKSSSGAAIGSAINAEICKLGFYNRGVKRANFYVLSRTSMPAVLIECCFIDSAKDMLLFDSKKMSDAIVKGLVGELPPNISFEKANLQIKHQTWLKPSTEQSSKIPLNKLRRVLPGYYPINYLGAEEGHYQIQYQGADYFVYSGHAKIVGL